MSDSAYYTQIHPIHDGKECRDTFDNYQLWIREFYVNDILNGPRTVYYPATGQIKISETYRNGKREGERKSWHSNGQLWESEFYIDGNPEGKFQSWNFDGSDCGEACYKNGKLEGISKCRYANGKLLSLTHYRDGMEIKYISWNIKGYPSYISYYQYYEQGCYKKETSWDFGGFRYHSGCKLLHDLPNGEYRKWNRRGDLEVHEYRQDGELIYSNFTAKSVIFRKLKTKLYIQVKKVVLSSFLISDLAISAINMIRI